jgi:hypothetical protein
MIICKYNVYFWKKKYAKIKDYLEIIAFHNSLGECANSTKCC